MRDLITYAADLDAFRAELATIEADEAHPLRPLVQEGAFTVGKVPVCVSGLESLSVVAGAHRSGGIGRDAIGEIASLVVLGEVVDGSYVFDSAEAKATYERVRGPLDVAYTDEDGNEQTYLKPYQIGVIA